MGAAPAPTTPTRRRAANGQSPKAKRATQRTVAPEPSEAPRASNQQVTIEVARLVAQGREDSAWFNGTTETLNSHADQIDALRGHVRDIQQGVNQNLSHITSTVDANDAALKANLKELETIVTNRGEQLNTQSLGSRACEIID